MFYRYEIKNNGKEEILYLYLTMNYEFSKELTSQGDDKDITRRTKNFIKNNSIDFKGEKVYLVIDGIVVKTLEIKKEEEIEKLSKNNEVYNNDYLVTIRFDNDIAIEISLKEYLLGALSANTIDNLELTTLKAICLLYRTYAYREMKENGYIKANNGYISYKPISYYKLFWVNNYQNNYNKLKKAISDTECEFITYKNDYILPFIHITSNGQTENNKLYPYLENRNSIWDYASPYYLEIKDYDYKYIGKVFNLKDDEVNDIEIIKLNENNHIEKIRIGKRNISGNTFRDLLNLKSTDINIIVNPTYIRFITKGWGNNLGLSQFGANEIAKVGCSYIDIIKYYFPKCSIKKYI